MGRMTPDAVRAAVIDCILSVAPEADFDALRPGKPWRDQLEIDSFDFQNILVAIDARLGVDVPESDYRKLATLDDLVAYVASRQSA
jgi:acyl carrier protein